MNTPRTKIALFTILLGLGQPLTGAASGGMEVTFVEAWLEAQRNSNFLQAESLNVERAQLKHDATRGLYFPRIDLNASYTQLDGAVTVDALDFNPLSGFAGDPVGESIIEILGGPEAFRTEITNERFGRVGLNAIWPVYTGGRITALRDATRAQADIAGELLDTQRRVLFEQVVRAYFGVVLARENLSIREEAGEGLAKHLNNAQKLEENGQIAKVERMSVAAAHDRAIVAVERARSELEIALTSLGELLMQQSQVNPIDKLFINQTLPTEEEFVIRILENSPALRELNARDTEAEALIRAQKGRFHPEVFVYADYELYKDDSITFELIPDWQVGVGLNFTLLDRIGRNKSVDAALRTRDAVTELSQGTRRALDLAARVSYREAEQALTEYHGLQSTVELARENLRLREIAFSQGMTTSVELVDAQLALSVVHAERSVAAYQFVVSLGRLLALGGDMNRFNEYQHTGQAITSGAGGNS